MLIGVERFALRNVREAVRQKYDRNSAFITDHIRSKWSESEENEANSIHLMAPDRLTCGRSQVQVLYRPPEQTPATERLQGFFISGSLFIVLNEAKKAGIQIINGRRTVRKSFLNKGNCIILVMGYYGRQIKNRPDFFDSI